MLTFAGKPTATVPAGAPILTESVDLSLAALSTLSISVYLALLEILWRPVVQACASEAAVG